MVKFLVGQVVKYFSCLSAYHCHRFMLVTLRATSRGHVKLKSVNPYEHPSIQPNYLSTNEDHREFADAVRLIREIFAQKAFDLFHGKELQPGG